MAVGTTAATSIENRNSKIAGNLDSTTGHSVDHRISQGSALPKLVRLQVQCVFQVLSVSPFFPVSQVSYVFQVFEVSDVFQSLPS
jgi:hypothetical protein